MVQDGWSQCNRSRESCHIHCIAQEHAHHARAVLADIAASSKAAGVLAQRYGIIDADRLQVQKSPAFGDRCHTVHRPQTVLTPAQAVILHSQLG